MSEETTPEETVPAPVPAWPPYGSTVPPVKRRPPLAAMAILAGAALIVGLGIGVAVPKPAPASCASAFSHGEVVINSAAKVLDMFGPALKAAASWDAAGLRSSTSGVDEQTRVIKAEGDQYKTDKASCLSGR